MITDHKSYMILYDVNVPVPECKVQTLIRFHWSFSQQRRRFASMFVQHQE